MWYVLVILVQFDYNIIIGLHFLHFFMQKVPGVSSNTKYFENEKSEGETSFGHATLL